MTYEEIYSDWEYLWSIGAANDMTGGYCDQEDLDQLLKSPKKSTAKNCLRSQIWYWFTVGPDTDGHCEASDARIALQVLLNCNERVQTIGEKYGY